ncbi:hypothetical protein TRFO_08008 [Tritrichomonas foetus]|uniref:I/LWEQ domain-containing protein n=1 Tax=Tritrichomonas foetus TaxID=1144522 RepID=A0A1J4JNP3_9EUKA|nr:hypothetical protein TRFO_08008 [Tritrichomonas foetus]|eukprot:OHT00338.1 hypothetical protein TRFO_08008 [Tritrichomonas foetus]
MSGYVPFANNISKYKFKSPTEILPQGKVPLVLNIVGFYIQRTRVQIERIQQNLHLILEAIPKITEGPQAQLSIYYNRISCLSGILVQACGEMDKGLTDGYKCSEIIMAAFGYLGQFQQYLPTLISASASQMTSYIPALKECIETVINNFQTTLDKIKQCEEFVVKSVPAIDFTKNPVATTAAALLYISEQLIVDINFLLQNDAVKHSPQHEEQLKHWLNLITQFSGNVFTNALANPNTVIGSTSAIAAASPSLISTVGSLQSFADNAVDFSQIGSNAILFMQLLHSLEILSTLSYAKSLIPRGPQVYTTKAGSDELVQYANRLFPHVSNKLRENTTRDAAAINGAIKNMLEYASSSAEISVFAMVQIVRNYCICLPDSEAGEAILLDVVKISNDIVLNIFERAKDLTKQIQELYQQHLVDFNEKNLGEINYYTTHILEVQTLSITSPNYMKDLKKVVSCFGALPRVIRKLESNSNVEELKTKFEDFAKKVEGIGDEFSNWTHQILMSLSEIIIKQAELTDNTLMLCQYYGVRLPDDLTPISTKLHATLKDMSHFLYYDLGQIKTVIDTFKQIQSHITFYQQLVAAKSKDPLLQIASLAFRYITKPINALAASLVNYIEFEDNDSFMTFINYVLNSASNQINNATAALSSFPPSLTTLYSIPFSQLYSSFSAITNYPDFGGMIANFKNMVSPPIESLWPAVIGLSAGGVVTDTGSIPQHVKVLMQVISDIASVADKMKAPNISCDLPESIKNVKEFEMRLTSLSENLKGIAEFLLNAIKSADHPDAYKVLQAWMKYLDTPSIDFDHFAQKLREAIAELVSGKTTVNDNLIDAFAAVSVAIARMILGEPYDTLLSSLHNQLIEALSQYFKSGCKDFSALKRMYGLVEAICTLIKASKANTEDRNGLYTNSLRCSLRGLNVVRAHGNQTPPEDLLDCHRSLGMLNSLLTILATTVPTGKELTQVVTLINDSILAGTQTNEQLTNAIAHLSAELARIRTFSFESITGIAKIEDLLDLIYLKTEMFRKYSNGLLKLVKAKSHDTNSLSENLNAIATAAHEAAGITIRSLALSNLKESPVAEQTVLAYSELNEALADLIPLTFRSNEENFNEFMSLRRYLRKIAKKFDDFINIVESPTKPTEQFTPFDLMKLKVYSDIADVSFEVASINWIACCSFSPEMYNDKVDGFTRSISARYFQMKATGEEILRTAVGDTAVSFKNQLEEFQNEIGYLLYAATNIDFALHLPIEGLCELTKKTSLSILELTNLTHSLMDKIVIKPDPEAVAKLPDDYVIPQAPETGSSVANALDLLKTSHASLNTALEEFTKVISNSGSTSDTLLKALSALKEALDTFIEHTLLLTVSTKDVNVQLQLQTALHSVASSFTGIKDALGMRLMRADKYENAMEEALTAFRKAIQSVMTAAEGASKDASDQDQVSRELEATASAIEEMTRRLKTIEAEATTSSSSQSHNVTANIEAAEGSLAAFVITHANPILVAAAQGVKRAQQITQMMIQKYGKIENEQLLIRSAKELSDAAALLIFAAEVVVHAENEVAVFKVIAAAKIVKASVCALVAQVLVKGGDPEQIMDKHVKTVIEHTDLIIKRGESIALAIAVEEEKKVKKAPSLMAQKLNLQSRINEIRKQMQEEEQTLYKFRKRF